MPRDALKETLDWVAIRRLHARYADAVNRRAWSELEELFLPEAVARYVARLVAATHAGSPSCPESLRGRVRHGASPRAAIAITEAARAAALLEQRPNVDFADVQRVAVPAIAHRIVLDHAARLDGMTARDFVTRLLEAVDPMGVGLPEGVR